MLVWYNKAAEHLDCSLVVGGDVNIHVPELCVPSHNCPCLSTHAKLRFVPNARDRTHLERGQAARCVCPTNRVCIRTRMKHLSQEEN